MEVDEVVPSNMLGFVDAPDLLPTIPPWTTETGGVEDACLGTSNLLDCTALDILETGDGVGADTGAEAGADTGAGA